MNKPGFLLAETCNFSITSVGTRVSCLAGFHRAVILLGGRTVLTVLTVLAIIVTADYLLFSFDAQSGIRSGFLGSLGIRTTIIVSVVGGSAFITGFGSRDVIGRVAAARQRSRLKSVQH